MSLSLVIEDPSGESRLFPLTQALLDSSRVTPLKLGRTPVSDLVLRDPTLPEHAATLTLDSKGSTLWVRSAQDTLNFKLGDFVAREMAWPLEMPLKLGETTLTLRKSRTSNFELPEVPRSVRAWQTVSESGRQLLWNLKKSSATPLSIYLAGETGTGKEVLANLIHVWSERASGPFVPLNCGALPLNLVESELFGHTKGAFTGAIAQRPGALLQAHGGTLFLDEIGDLPLDIQVKLLRFLEDGEIRAVGSDTRSHANVRLICATHKPLAELVEAGTFRRDLYYRLASIGLTIPTLRDRPEDIAHLARVFASEFSRTLSPQAVLRLQAHNWPGNVRELRHAVERACGMAGPFETVLKESDFEFLGFSAQRSNQTAPKPENAPVLTLSEMERFMVLKALKIARGNRAQAAKILGVARSTLFEMLKRHGIQGPRARDVAFEELLSAAK